ncbi:hypothetical protein Tco_1352853 [Tanacetum coccineum]
MLVEQKKEHIDFNADLISTVGSVGTLLEIADSKSFWDMSCIMENREDVYPVCARKHYIRAYTSLFLLALAASEVFFGADTEEMQKSVCGLVPW